MQSAEAGGEAGAAGSAMPLRELSEASDDLGLLDEEHEPEALLEHLDQHLAEIALASDTPTRDGLCKALLSAFERELIFWDAEAKRLEKMLRSHEESMRGACIAVDMTRDMGTAVETCVKLDMALEIAERAHRSQDFHTSSSYRRLSIRLMLQHDRMKKVQSKMRMWDEACGKRDMPLIQALLGCGAPRFKPKPVGNLPTFKSPY